YPSSVTFYTYCRMVRLPCFFFQAEDGIRPFHVTGVQTVCSSDLLPPPDPGPGEPARPHRAPGHAGPLRRGPAGHGRGVHRQLLRSEERREGKSVGLGGGRIGEQLGDTNGIRTSVTSRDTTLRNRC